MPTRPALAASLIAFATLVACATLGRPSSPTLVGREWRLIELRGQPAPPGSGMRRAHLRFSAEGMRVSGSGGCNEISGTYSRDGDRLTFASVRTTLRACVDAQLNRQEADFITAVTETNRYEVAGGDTLSLARDGNRLARLLGAPR